MHHTVNKPEVLTLSVNIPACFNVVTTIVREFILLSKSPLLKTIFNSGDLSDMVNSLRF